MNNGKREEKEQSTNDSKITCLPLLTAHCSLLICIFVLSCSTAPKNPGEITTLRRTAESQLDLANKQADRGVLGDAILFADEAKRLAVVTDDSDLLVRTRLSRGNILFLLGHADEAVAEWNAALAEAERARNSELVALSRIHIARGKLLSPGGKASAQTVRDETTRNVAQIKTNRYYIAFAWTVIGLAERDLGRYAEAEAALRRSLDIHQKDRYFELAAYDWYLTASFRSLSGNYNGALQALESALELDRRMENSWGLANDWRAIGDVQKKAGNRDAARAAYTRSAEIFHSLAHPEAAEEALSRISD
jgi:tetratricopeptide (TPR) repeat protein